MIEREQVYFSSSVIMTEWFVADRVYSLRTKVGKIGHVVSTRSYPPGLWGSTETIGHASKQQAIRWSYLVNRRHAIVDPEQNICIKTNSSRHFLVDLGSGNRATSSISI